MNNNVADSRTTRTFRFASGQLLTLKMDQIAKIPYMAAMVSSEDNFKSIHDENGHLKLDLFIDFEQFSFAIKLLKFRSIRQIFTKLPKEQDICSTIDLLDFLGLLPYGNPTLREIDSTFFSNLVYSPVLKRHIQVIKPANLLDMAARFGIAILREEYDFTNRQVLDQIYWFTMFIISSFKFFGPRHRHHMHNIAVYCFSRFGRFLLKPLKKLFYKTIQMGKKNRLFSNFNDENIFSDYEMQYEWEKESLDFDAYGWFSISWPEISLRKRLSNRKSADYTYRRKYPFTEKELFMPLREHIVEIMYERLQGEIYQQAKTKIIGCGQQNTKKKTYDWILNSVVEVETVKEQIRNFILHEIPVFIQTIESMQKELVEKLRTYEQNGYMRNEYYTFFYRDRLEINPWNFERMQETALLYYCMQDKLRQCPDSMIEQICQKVIQELYEVALKQISKWEHTAEEIVQLRQELSTEFSFIELAQLVSKPTQRKYSPTPQNFFPKTPFPKIQPKYSMR